MELQHIDIEHLKTTNINVRKIGATDIGDLLPSIRSLGVLQPLLVRPNCEGYEIIAGQRRYHAALKLSEEGKTDPLPCIIMDDDDDAKAIEASLAENVARLPMDEIDQYKAFLALSKAGKSVGDIANDFGVTDRLVKQRLAIANLIAPILTAYRKQEINASTIRHLTMATKRQQKEWWKLYHSDEYAPQGHALKEWLFGGADISVNNALFNLNDYKAGIVTDLFSENRYFDDASLFWELQNIAIAKAKACYLEHGWSNVHILEVGSYFSSYDYCTVAKQKGGHVYVQITYSGEVIFHEGYLTKKEALRQEKLKKGEASEPTVARPELTKVMQHYLNLHRHSVVRNALLNQSHIALRLAVAQIIAGSELWCIHAEPQKANSNAIALSLEANKAESKFASERKAICNLLGCGNDADNTLVYGKGDWSKTHNLYEIFARLLALSDEQVMSILTFVVAETLPNGSAMVEVLGYLLSVDMAESWTPDDTFFDLLRDKEAINAILKDVGGKATADAHITSTAKIQKQIIRDYLDGTRKDGKTDWRPRYMRFPCATYTERNEVEAVALWNDVKQHFC